MRPVLVEAAFDGWEFSESDQPDLREAFNGFDTAALRVSGGWAPAAIPPATVEVVVTFVGQTILGLIIERTLEAAWKATAHAIRDFRQRRAARSLQRPQTSRFIVRADDFEVIIHGAIDLDSDFVLATVGLLAKRRESGLLAGFPIRRIELPCFESEGYWEVVDRYGDAASANFSVWYVESLEADPMSSYYDAADDCWIRP